MFLQWLLWYAVGITASATEFGRWKRTGGKTPWYLSSSPGSGTFTNYDSNDWKPYHATNDELPQRNVATYTRNNASQLLENGELLWNIQNVLQKISSQINMNDLRNIWNSIQNGALGEKIEMFFQQRQRERQSHSNGYDTFWTQPR